MHHNPLRALLLSLALCTLTGCNDGPQIVPVSGQVTIDGKPLTYGTVMFVNTGSRPASGRLDSEGRFQLSCFEEGDGAIVGRHRVSVMAIESMGEHANKWHAPQNYANERTSNIEFDITQPVDDLKIELTWNGKKPFIERW